MKGARIPTPANHASPTRSIVTHRTTIRTTYYSTRRTCTAAAVFITWKKRQSMIIAVFVRADMIGPASASASVARPPRSPSNSSVAHPVPGGPVHMATPIARYARAAAERSSLALPNTEPTRRYDEPNEHLSVATVLARPRRRKGENYVCDRADVVCNVEECGSGYEARGSWPLLFSIFHDDDVPSQLQQQWRSYRGDKHTTSDLFEM